MDKTTTSLQNFTWDELNTMICTENRTEMFAHLGLCLIGVVCTATNTIVLTRKQMRQSTINLLLAAIEFSNVVFLIFYFPSLIFRLVCPVKLFSSWIMMVFSVLGNIPRSLVIFTNWMTFIVGTWRFCAIAWPLRTRSCLTNKAAMIAITCTGAVSLGLSLYSYFGLYTERVTVRVVRADGTSEVLTIYNRTTGTLSSTHFYDFNKPLMVAIQILGYVIPCALTLTANAALIANVLVKAIRRRKLTEGQTGQNRGETRMTAVLVVLLSANVFCFVTPGFFILNNSLCDEDDCGPSMPEPWHSIFHDFQAVLVLNCLTFFGYYLMSSKFRETFRGLCADIYAKLVGIRSLCNSA